MDRFGEVEELIGSVLFLACEEASGFVNGACIPIDGAFAGILRRIKACKGAGRGRQYMRWNNGVF